MAKRVTPAERLGLLRGLIDLAIADPTPASVRTARTAALRVGLLDSLADVDLIVAAVLPRLGGASGELLDDLAAGVDAERGRREG